MLEGKKVLVAGGANGIGRATVSLAAAEGADVAIFDTDIPRMKEAAREVEVSGRIACPEHVDVTDRAQVDSAVQRVLERFGHIDVLVCAVGGSGTSPTFMERDPDTGDYLYKLEGVRRLRVEQISEEDWDHTMELNVKSVYLCVRAVVPSMRARRRGAIVAFSSIGGFIGMPDSAFAYAAYAASKAAVAGFVRHMANELGHFGIRANCVSPGTVGNPRMVVRAETYTRALEQARSEGEEVPESTRASIPLGRASTTDEQAQAVVFLASDRASYINGVTLDVNGGRYMQ
jgi:3-oxoacyl-[acyl-carrier protein] reductase